MQMLCVESPGISIHPLTYKERRQARKNFGLNPDATLFCFSFDLNFDRAKKPLGVHQCLSTGVPTCTYGRAAI